MDSLAERISGSELEVMKVLWEAEDALPVTVIRETLAERKGWEGTTVKTLISRLGGKEVVRQEKRKVFYYTPLISEPFCNFLRFKAIGTPSGAQIFCARKHKPKLPHSN